MIVKPLWRRYLWRGFFILPIFPTLMSGTSCRNDERLPILLPNGFPKELCTSEQTPVKTDNRSFCGDCPKSYRKVNFKKKL